VPSLVDGLSLFFYPINKTELREIEADLRPRGQRGGRGVERRGGTAG
jgi:hypothetical protein